MKYKSNLKQFELNARLYSILESIEIQSECGEPSLERIKVSQEGKQLISKRQKLIKIIGKSRDGWQVVAEYESDELASRSEDEKHLKKAREAANPKRRLRDQVTSERGKKTRIGTDNQLFRGKTLGLSFDFVNSCGLDPLAYPPIFFVLIC